MKETDIQRGVLQLLGLMGIFAWRSNNAPTYDPKRGCYRKAVCMRGVPDITGILPNGRFLGIEVKTPIGKVSPEQQAFHQIAEHNGAAIFVVRSVKEAQDAINSCLGEL